jgi:hypothetical protein
VEHDHHAFTWWEPSRLAVVPVSRYGPVVSSPGAEPGVEEPDRVAPEQVDQLHAAIGYRIDGDEIREVGRASQASHIDPNTGGAEIQRSIVIGDQLFTISFAGVMSSELDSFDERGWLAF